MDSNGGDLEGSGARRSSDREFFTGLARAVGGALVFSLPMLMTMEMWWLGFYIDRLRFALLVVLTVPMLAWLSSVSGFKRSSGVLENVVDAFVALAVGYVTSALILWLFGILDGTMSVAEFVGKVALQAVPASIGALLAGSQFSGTESDSPREKPDQSYADELLLMLVGALFLAFNVAPTQEMPVIAEKIGPGLALLVALVSIVVMHAFVYAVHFSGQAKPEPGTPLAMLLLRFTVVGYAVSLLVSLYVLWTFGRVDGNGAEVIVRTTVVLGFPAAVGAAAARLII